MPRYDYRCSGCGVRFERERPMGEASQPAECPVCAGEGERVLTMPRLLLKADPRDTRPVWHTHDGYGHAHAPRRGRHRTPAEDH